MQIRIASLKEGHNPVEETIDAKDLGLDPEHFTSPVKVSGSVENGERTIDIRLHVQTEGHYICDRCAIDFERTFDVDVRTVGLRREADDSDEEESEGLIFINDKDEFIDLSEEILAAIVFDLPLLIHCRENCKGLCHVCGADLNEDPVICLRREGDNRECPHTEIASRETD